MCLYLLLLPLLPSFKYHFNHDHLLPVPYWFQSKTHFPWRHSPLQTPSSMDWQWFVPSLGSVWLPESVDSAHPRLPATLTTSLIYKLAVWIWEPGGYLFSLLHWFCLWTLAQKEERRKKKKKKVLNSILLYIVSALAIVVFASQLACQLLKL